MTSLRLGPLAPVGRFFKTLHHNDAQLLVWLNGLEFVPSAILTPIITQQQLKQTQLPKREQTLLVRQEILRQVISATLWMTSYYGWVIFNNTTLAKWLKRPKPSSLMGFAGGVAVSTITSGLLRPLLLNHLLVKWLYGDAATAPPSPKTTLLPPVRGLPPQGAATRLGFASGAPAAMAATPSPWQPFQSTSPGQSLSRSA